MTLVQPKQMWYVPSLPLLNKNIFEKSLILSYLGFIFLFFYDILLLSVYKAI